MEHPLITYTPASEAVLAEDVSRNLEAAFRKQYGALYPGIVQNMRLAGDWVENRMTDRFCREIPIPRLRSDNLRVLSRDQIYLLLPSS